MFDLYRRPKILRIRTQLLLAGLLSLVFIPATAEGKKTLRPNYGTIKIQSNPPNLPLELDGKSYGTTSTEYTTINLEAGVHTIIITLPDGNRWRREVELSAGRVKCVSLKYRPASVLATIPCPFPVKLSGPAQVSEGQIVTFSSEAYYPGLSSLHYTWTLNPATAHILRGDTTSKIEVDTTGLAGQRITATLLIDDGSGDSACRQVREVSILVPPAEKQTIVAKKFDVCCSCSFDDQKARLDNLAIELQNDPSARAYVIAYTKRSPRTAKNDFLLLRARDYLVTHRGLNASRIMTINGGDRDSDCVELWVGPLGTKPPSPGVVSNGNAYSGLSGPQCKGHGGKPCQ
jgi:PEGA domain